MEVKFRQARPAMLVTCMCGEASSCFCESVCVTSLVFLCVCVSDSLMVESNLDAAEVKQLLAKGTAERDRLDVERVSGRETETGYLARG